MKLSWGTGVTSLVTGVRFRWRCCMPTDDQVRERIKAKWKTQECPKCGGEERTPTGTVLAPFVINGNEVDFAQGVPLAAVICDACGFTEFIHVNAAQLPLENRAPGVSPDRPPVSEF